MIRLVGRRSYGGKADTQHKATYNDEQPSPRALAKLHTQLRTRRSFKKYGRLEPKRAALGHGFLA